MTTTIKLLFKQKLKELKNELWGVYTLGYLRYFNKYFTVMVSCQKLIKIDSI